MVAGAAWMGCCGNLRISGGEMKIRVVREISAHGATLGTLYVNGVEFCSTLEDEDRFLESGGVKEYGETAIPRGRYAVEVTRSNRFKRELPEVLDVPGFTGIRIHPGNVAADTHGCLLVGRSDGPARVGNSRVVFEKLFALIGDAYKRDEPIELEIE